jgi:pyruvate,water dikinase
VSVVPLAEATDPGAYGGKAVQLGAALRAGLAVPGGFALSCGAVDAVASGDVDVLAPLTDVCTHDRPHAVRSSAVGEDSEAASFAGAHLTVLGVCGVAAVAQAVRQVHASGFDARARVYRERLGLDTRAQMAVVVQELIDADAAGVLFTRNPVTGAAERVIEASWGLGEAVVSGLVTPDHFVLDRAGRLQHLVVGEKDVAIRQDGQGTVEVTVPEHLVATPCLGAAELAALDGLATTCDVVFGSAEHDIEFAFRSGTVFLLQRRAITGG